MNKMVINQHDKIFVTNDAATIVRELDIVHPAAKMVVMAANMQEQEVSQCFLPSHLVKFLTNPIFFFYTSSEMGPTLSFRLLVSCWCKPSHSSAWASILAKSLLAIPKLPRSLPSSSKVPPLVRCGLSIDPLIFSPHCE